MERGDPIFHDNIAQAGFGDTRRRVRRGRLVPVATHRADTGGFDTGTARQCRYPPARSRLQREQAHRPHTCGPTRVIAWQAARCSRLQVDVPCAGAHPQGISGNPGVSEGPIRREGIGAQARTARLRTRRATAIYSRGTALVDAVGRASARHALRGIISSGSPTTAERRNRVRPAPRFRVLRTDPSRPISSRRGARPSRGSRRGCRAPRARRGGRLRVSCRASCRAGCWCHRRLRR